MADAEEPGPGASASEDGRDDDTPRGSPSRPPRWIWWVGGLVLVVFVVAIAFSRSSDDGDATTTTGDAVPQAPSAELDRVVVPALDGYRIVAPASGSEVLSRAEIEGRSASARVVPVPGARAVVGRRRDFESTTTDDVVRVVLLRMRTPADARRARQDLQQWWTRQPGAVLDDRVPIGSTTAAVGTSGAADANGDHIQIAVGATGRTVFVVLRFSKAPPADTSALLKVATDQALRLQRG